MALQNPTYDSQAAKDGLKVMNEPSSKGAYMEKENKMAHEESEGKIPWSEIANKSKSPLTDLATQKIAVSHPLMGKEENSDRGLGKSPAKK